MRLKGFKIGKSKEKPEEDTAVAGDTPAAQTVEMEEQLNNKTEDLAKTQQPSGELADTAKDSEKDEDTSPQPHGPLGELSIEPQDQLQELDEEIDTDTLLGDADEEVKVVKIGGGAAAPAEEAKVVEVGAGAAAPAEDKKEPTKEEGSDSLTNFFGDEEEDENPLANLINSLPDVTTQELLDDLQEIEGIIHDQQG
jgi:hypothetical protein